MATFRPHQAFSTFVLLAVLSAGCASATKTPTATEAPVLPTVAHTVTALAVTETPNPAATVTTTATATRIPRPPTPAPSATAEFQLLACREGPPAAEEEAQPVRLLYANDNKVWSWDEANGASLQLPLPDDAVAPLISEDGRLAAFLIEGQAYDTPQRRVERIPLWMFDTQAYTAREVASFSTTEMRRLYPESPWVMLKMEWLPASHRLLVQVYPYPWGEGIMQPTGPLYLVDADANTTQQILPGGGYDRYGIHPEGKQIAALDSEVYSPEGDINWDVESLQDGELLLIDTVSASIIFSTPVRLPADPWGFMNPVYSPDGSKVAYNTASGIEVDFIGLRTVLEAPLANTCLAANNCYWTDYLPIYWLPDSRSFYTMQSINDFYDQRAVTTLLRIALDPGPVIEPIMTLQANQGTFLFSPDRRILSYWNQPDIDQLNQGLGDMNRVTLSLMDVQEGLPKQYAEEYVLRVRQWHPDNRRFLYTYSSFGGPNPVTTQLALGDICQPPQELMTPEASIVNQARWLRGNRFLAWTLPSTGTSDRYPGGLYLYDLVRGNTPIYIADLIQDSTDPYGVQEQVVVLSE